ncbi:MAG TPA: ATP-binding protein [Longimicrobiaceae bacterium]|nr:ATP-binding protein [Longimicrobiaceae bacterium]
MRRVLTVPTTLDDQAFDTLVAEAGEPQTGGILVDARHVRWADPYGMIGLLALGQRLGGGGVRPLLQPPDAPDVVSYLERMGLFRAAAGIFEMPGAPRQRRPVAAAGGKSSGAPAAKNVLLEITPIRSHEDVHGVIENLQDRAGAILTDQLGYSLADAGMFSMVLSEVCQNIIEHAEAGGWVGIQTYKWARRLGRQVVMIAVMDTGVGFRGSLAKEHAARFGDRWSDYTALEAAFLQGVTRFRDPGRGQGLKQIRRRVTGWGGKISIRSGTARIAQIPEWDDDPPMQKDLGAFPGSQILIVLPAHAKS